MAQYVSSSVSVPTHSDPFVAVPTPFASHAFHPLDGYLQSVPYHVFIFVFPLHRWLYLGLFVFVNFWSILVCLHLNLLHLNSYSEFADPRLRHDYGSRSRESHQRTGAPYLASSLFHC